MNIQLTLPIDCVVLQSPTTHTFQSTPLYIIPNPLQALAIHSGCHLGRFPFVPFSFNLISYIMRRYYGITSLPRFPPFKRAKQLPPSTLCVNGTDHSAALFASHEQSSTIHCRNSLAQNRTQQPSQINTTGNQQGHQSNSEPTPSTNTDSSHHYTKSFLEHLTTFTQTPPTYLPTQPTQSQLDQPQSQRPSHQLDLYSVFLLTSAEVSVLLSNNIIKLIYPQHHTHSDLPPSHPTNRLTTPSSPPRSLLDIDTSQLFSSNPPLTRSNSPSSPGRPFRTTLDKKVDIVGLFARSGWRLAQCLRYACANTVYRYKPYPKHSLLPIPQSHPSQFHPPRKQPTPPSQSPPSHCPLHPAVTLGGTLPQATSPTLIDSSETIHCTTGDSQPSERLVKKQQPLQSQSTSPQTCTCPIVNINASPTTPAISHLITLPLQHPPHDHSSFTFLYPDNLSSSFSARQPFQLFSGYNNAMIQRTVNHDYQPDSTRTASSILPPSSCSHRETPPQKPLPSSQFGENRVLSIFGGQSEPVIGFSSRVSKDHYKVLTVVRPVYTAPISAYKIDSMSDIDETQQKDDKTQHPQSVLRHQQQPRRQLTSSFGRNHPQYPSKDTSQCDLEFLFGTQPSTRTSRLIASPHQSHRASDHQPLQPQPCTNNQLPSQQVMLVANRIKFSHYSNRIPVHPTKE